MALAQSSEALRRPQKLLWASFPAVALASLVLGYFGLAEFVAGNPQYGHRFVDVLYYDVQLLVMGSDPLQSAGPYPLALDVARFSAPAVTIYAAIEALRLLLSVELSRLRARRSSGHAIVCGDTPLADALTRRLQDDGVSVVEIRATPDDFVTPGEALRIVGDARDPRVLLSAGLAHAESVYACAAESATNVAVALSVTRTVGSQGERLRVHGLVADPDFCATVQAFFLGRPPPGRTRLDFFNIDHIAARRLFGDDERPFPAGRAPRLLVAGTDGFARACVVEAARTWRALHGDGPPLAIDLVGPDAPAVAAELHRRFPFLGRAVAVTPVPGELLTLLLDGHPLATPAWTVVTYDDEDFALRTAMTAERHWRGGSGRITVRLEGALIGVPTANSSIDVADGGLHVFGAVAAAGDPGLIHDDLTERLARVLHDRYLMGRRARGDGSAGRALVAWDRLPADLQLSNRTQAEDIGRKLASIGYVILPRHRQEHREESFSSGEIDRLAMMEHERWCHERRTAGWRYGPRLDEGRKHHPGLLVWSQLPDLLRQRNYDPVRDLPLILGDAGFRIVRA